MLPAEMRLTSFLIPGSSECACDKDNASRFNRLSLRDVWDASIEKNVSQNHERRREQQQIKQKSKIPSNVFTNRITFCFQHDYAFALSAVCAWEK